MVVCFVTTAFVAHYHRREHTYRDKNAAFHPPSYQRPPLLIVSLSSRGLLPHKLCTSPAAFSSLLITVIYQPMIFPHVRRSESYHHHHLLTYIFFSSMCTDLNLLIIMFLTYKKKTMHVSWAIDQLFFINIAEMRVML